MLLFNKKNTKQKKSPTLHYSQLHDNTKNVLQVSRHKFKPYKSLYYKNNSYNVNAKLLST